MPGGDAAGERDAGSEATPATEFVEAQNAGGIRVHVPDAAAAPPEAVVVEGETVIAVGHDVPADRSGDEVPGREATDHFVEFRDRTDDDPHDPALPAGVDRIRDGGTAHVERKRRTVAPTHQRLIDNLVDKYDDEAVSLAAHRLYGSSALTSGGSGGRSKHRLGNRVHLLEGPDGVVGLHYQVPVDDDPAEALVVTDADRVLRALRESPRDPFDGVDPDVLVAPGAAGDDRAGTLLDEFSPAVYVSTTAEVADETRAIASDEDVYVGRAGTGTKKIVTLGAHGVEDHTLPISAGMVRSTEGEGVDGDRSGHGR